MTIKDIANKAGVSIASVSRYFNNKSLLSSDTCLRIEKVVNEHNYIPNTLGRLNRISRSGKILVILPTISNPIYQKILHAINTECRKYGYTVLTCTTNNDNYIEKHLLTMLETYYADGVIFFSTTLNKTELEQLNKKFPIVQCCEYVDAEISGVTIDNETAVFEACTYLIKNGHSRIAMISGMTDYGTTISRENGYIKALKEAEMTIKPEYLIRGQYGFSSGERAAKELLNLKKTEFPDALVTISDAVAIGAAKKFLKNGVQIPGDISIIGFDDTSMAAMYNPPLSSVKQAREEMGKKAAELLFERMESLKGKTRLIMLEHKLVIRESVKIMRK